MCRQILRYALSKGRGAAGIALTWRRQYPGRCRGVGAIVDTHEIEPRGRRHRPACRAVRARRALAAGPWPSSGLPDELQRAHQRPDLACRNERAERLDPHFLVVARVTERTSSSSPGHLAWQAAARNVVKSWRPTRTLSGRVHGGRIDGRAGATNTRLRSSAGAPCVPTGGSGSAGRCAEARVEILTGLAAVEHGNGRGLQVIVESVAHRVCG